MPAALISMCDMFCALCLSGLAKRAVIVIRVWGAQMNSQDLNQSSSVFSPGTCYCQLSPQKHHQSFLPLPVHP